jgi:phosphatidate cytidylyltransferase
MFSKRLVSSIVLWSVLLSVLFYLPPPASALLCCLVSMLGLWEFYDILIRGGLKCAKVWGVIGGILLSAGTWYCSAYEPEMTNTFEIMFIVCFVLALFTRQLMDKNNPDGIQTISNTLLGIVYVPWLFNFFPKIKYFYNGFEGPGWLFAFYLVVVTKLGDTGAYLVGRAFGRHKMMPRISPNKTWEGLLGGFVFSIIGSVSVLNWEGFAQKIAPLRFNQTDAIILGVLLGVVGVIGDLSESLIKREVHVKDSGEVLPGIGGALDLIDSLLFTAPILYAYLVFFVHP